MTIVARARHSGRALVIAVAAVAALAALAACGARGEQGPTTLQTRLDRQLAANAERYGIAGQAVVILHNGEVLYRGHGGLADRATGRAVRAGDVFPVYSVAKLFVSALIFQLVESGAVALDQPASRYVPDLPEAWRAVAVGELLDHVSGLPDYFDSRDLTRPLPPTREAAFASLAAQPLQFEAGTASRYNQINFIILAALLEAHYQAPYRQIVADRILTPLGMTSTYLGKAAAPAARLVSSYRGVDDALADDQVIPWPDYAIAHAEVYTTAEDLGAYLTAIAAGRIVSRETLLRLWKPRRLRDGSTIDWAAGWDYGSDDRFQNVGHDGGTKVRARLLFDPTLTDSYVVIYLTNGSATNVWSRTLVESVTSIVTSQARSIVIPAR